MKIVYLIIFSFLIYSNTWCQPFPWPISPTNAVHPIGGSIGEYRNTNRLHLGTDISAPANVDVLCISEGNVTSVYGQGTTSPTVVIGEMKYVHVVPSVVVGQHITRGSVIGKIYDGANDHVHMEIDDDLISENLLIHLSGYADAISPYIQQIQLRNEGATRTNPTDLFSEIFSINNVNYTKVYKKIDIIARIGDPRVAGTTQPNIAPYIIEYCINNINNTFHECITNFNFNEKPISGRGLNCFYVGTLQDGGIYNYILTSHPHAGQANRYFNTQLNASYAPQTVWNVGENYNAHCTQECYYKDGLYEIVVNTRDVDNDGTFNTATKSCNLLIDNFIPYIQRVKIREAGTDVYKYNRGWYWTANQLFLEPNTSEIFDSNADAVIDITTSEPVKSITLNVGTFTMTKNCNAELNKTEWQFIIPASSLNNDQNVLNISCIDFANNNNQSNPANIPIRQENGSWSPLPAPDIDSYHSFIRGEAFVDFKAIQLGTNEYTVKFTDNSSPLITGNYFWSFGDSYPTGTSTLKDVTYQYDLPGTYLVNHSVGNQSRTKPVTVVPLTPPVSNFNYSVEFNEQKNASQLNIDFFDKSEGIIATYAWDFGNGMTSSEKKPEDIIFEINTYYDVTLTVTNLHGSDSYIETIYVDPNAYPFIAIFDFPLNYFNHDLEISTSNFYPDGLKTFEIDFGDGTSSTVMSDDWYYTFSHQYFEYGDYLVVATVTGLDNDQNEISVTNATEIRVMPYELDVNIVQSPITEIYPLTNASFTAQVAGNPGDYYGFWTIYKLDDPTYTHDVLMDSDDPTLDYSFPTAADYKVTLTIVSPAYGFDYVDVNVINAPDYMEAFISGPNTIANNSSATFFTTIFPIGDPNVPESEWYATDLKWTLEGPNGYIINLPTDQFHYTEAQYLHPKTFNFTQPGIYKLTVQAWSDRHEYEQNNQIAPIYCNTISFYDYCEKEIEVIDDMPALIILEPISSLPANVSADGNTPVVLTFSNPGTLINWTVSEVCNDCFVNNPQLPITGYLANGNTNTLQIYPSPNLQLNSRSTRIMITAKDPAGNDVQGSPASFWLTQNGINGLEFDTIKGTTEYERFGSAVAIDATTIIIGSPSNHSTLSGSVFVYNKNNFGDWIKKAQLLPPSTNPHFGKTIDIEGEHIIVGGDGSNSVYIYKKPLNGWAGVITSCKQIIPPFTNNHTLDVAIWGDYAAIGATFINNIGQVRIYYRNQGGIDNWGEMKCINSPAADDQFGESVDLYNDILIIGAPEGGWDPGYIRIYNRNAAYSNDWGWMQDLHPPSGSTSPDVKFGQRVSIYDNALTTCYGYGIGPYQFIDLPIYGKMENDLFQFIWNGGRNNYDETENPITSISIYKSKNSELSSLRQYATIAGEQFYWEDYGRYLTSYFTGEYEIQTYHNGPPEWYPNSYYPGDQYGRDVSGSFYFKVVGIPGYGYEAYGAAYVEQTDNFKTRFQAKVDLDLINFSKPAGIYSDINAHKLSLGGQGYQAVIESGAQILYEAGEITLNVGFEAQRGSEFTAKSLEETRENDKDSDEYKDQSLDYNLMTLQMIQKKYPDFPWVYYNPEDLVIRKLDGDLNLSDLNERAWDETKCKYYLQIENNEKWVTFPYQPIKETK